MRTTLLLAFALCGCSEEPAKLAETVGGSPHKGKSAIDRYGCASCHTIPGIHGANATVGPPLDRIGSRTYIGGVIHNNSDNMLRWLKNPPGVDPMTAMPNLNITDSDARDIAAYLYTLR
jgi:cytochrome c1